MFLKNFLARLLKKDKVKLVDDRELGLLKRAREEALGIDPTFNPNGDSEFPATALNTSISTKGGRGLKPIALKGNPFANNQIDNINRRYEESASRESRVSDN